MEQPEQFRSAEREKPPLLYHGSAEGDLEELEPISVSDRGPQAELFASQDPAVASIFLSPVKDMSSGIYRGVPYAYIKSSPDEFRERDKGGTIYVLPSDQFQCNTGKGMGKFEWYATEPVKPVRKIGYDSALDAMVENGVQVYFVDNETFRALRGAKDYRGRLEILRGLKSENEKRGLNVRPLLEK